MKAMMMRLTMAAATAGHLAGSGCSVQGEAADGASEEYLFGLSEDELLSMHHLVADKHDEAGWLELNRAPFVCANYGDLCAVVGREAAEDITREALFMALEGADLESIVESTDAMTSAAAAAWGELDRAFARASDVDTELYDCGNHRIRVETFKVNPAIGSRYGKASCKLQRDLGSGIWGGTDDFDEVTARVEITATGEFTQTTDQVVHSLESNKVFPGANQTVRGTCTGDHDGDIESVIEDIN